MHCNLKLLVVAPVVLGFYYDTHNATAYKFNNSSTYADSCTHVPNFNAIERTSAELLLFKYV